jgi:DNA-binding beta-propeller fold protein YncE
MPVSLAVTPAGQILVLDTSGRIWRADPLAGKWELEVLRHPVGTEPTVEIEGLPAHVRAPLERDHRSGRPLGPARAQALVTVQVGDKTEIVVTGYEPRSGGLNVLYIKRSELIHAKSTVQRVATFGLFAGLAADPGGSRVYLSNTRTAEIYTLHLTKRPSLEPFARPRGAVVLGPLAIDPDGNRLFVADVARGALFSVDIPAQEGTSPGDREIAVGLGEPIALALDDAAGRLYVADAAGRQIWVVDPEGHEAPKPLVLETELREPLALTILADGDLVVADAGPPAVYVFPRQGGAPRAVLTF